MFFWGTRNQVSIDIGADSVKIAESAGGKKIVYLGKKSVGLPEEPSHSEKKRERYKEILKEVYKERNLAEKKIFTAIQAETVMVKYLELPKLSKEELQVALPIEFDRLFPHSQDELIINHKIVPTPSGNSLRTGIIVSAIPKSLVEERKNLLYVSSSITPERISIPSTIALGKANLKSRFFEPDCFVALINAGMTYTNIALCRDSEIYHSRYFLMGGKDFTEAARMGKNITYADAEKIVREFNPLKGSNLHILAAIENWVEEIKRTIEFYSFGLTSNALKIKRILMSGGVARMPGIVEYVYRHTGIETLCDRLDVPNLSKLQKEMKISDDELLSYKIAIGLLF